MSKVNPHSIKPLFKDKYYVYELRKPNNEVFYVGKGKNKRINQHFYKKELDVKCHKTSIIKKYGNSIKRVIITYFDNENDAYDLEEWLIDFYGTKDVGGKLSNIVKNRDEVSYKCREKAKKYANGENARLGCSQETTLEIYKMYFTECMSKVYIANKLDLSYQIVRSRIAGDSRKELFDEYVNGGIINIIRESYEPDAFLFKPNLNIEKVKELRKRWLDGDYLSVLCKEVDVCPSTLKRIFIGNIRKGIFDTYHERPKNYKGKE